MKLIDISTPKHPNTFTMVDDEDYEYLNQWKWCLNEDGYATRMRQRSGVSKCIIMHREITKVPIGMFIDHKNGNRIDNQKENLRICTISENSMNRAAWLSRDLPKGVYQRVKGGRFQAQIKVNKKNIWLGQFDTVLDAANAYDEQAKKYHGEFARLNSLEINKTNIGGIK